MPRAVECIKALTNDFSLRGVADAANSARYIVEKACGQGVQRSTRLSTREWHRVVEAAFRRIRFEPVQYIIGDWDFRSLNNVIVRPPVLIPRPETEQLVDIALEHISQYTHDPKLGCEVGVGTGVISISLLKELPLLHMAGVDVDTTAIDLSRANATKYVT